MHISGYTSLPHFWGAGYYPIARERKKGRKYSTVVGRRRSLAINMSYMFINK